MSRPMTEYVKAIGAGFATLALVVGVPLGLVLLVGWPLPRSLPSAAEVSDAFRRQGVPPEALAKALAIVVWLAWAQLVRALMAEAIATGRGRAAQPAAVLPGIQVLAGQLIAGIALLASAAGPARPVSAAVLVSSPLQQLDGHLPGAATPLASPRPVPREAASSTPQQVTVSVTEREHTVYVTRRGDTFWRLAQEHLGAGSRWREIRDLNAGRAVAPNCVLAADEDRLRPGWRLLLPASPAPPGAPSASGLPASAPAGTLSGPHAAVTPADGMVRYDGDMVLPDQPKRRTEEPEGVEGLTVAFTPADPTGRGHGMVLYETNDVSDEEEDSSRGRRGVLATDVPPWRLGPAQVARHRR